ncbi:glycosyltransferase family 2 protein [Maritimibacter dapengensis]|uniref:Glycosyltransferase family 2 protein n=1 Tax=Maritimibacter dapengensis TaxID=2836868 RepID=A0ABS6T2S1_9RHOB|nr:glycosyltransferase family 2 protein [Maritimibacter dapengensis]MBV7379549.1 glycosyltransferase family 2 protein [Maritimibacter dapengensis]
MQDIAAALTMVRDDDFFLERWVAYYGDRLGRENCTIINHGNQDAVNRIGAGCNIIAIPDKSEKFDQRRWRLFNGIQSGLRGYYKYVIVGDVDEYVVVDPALGLDLLDFLAKAPRRKILTPLGLEVLHRINEETEPITGPILGPRRYARVSYHYSKPCVLGAPGEVSRGGHFAKYDQLHTPEALYLFHMKYCDVAQYTGLMDRRNASVGKSGLQKGETGIGGHWFPEERGDDRALFEGFVSRPIVRGFEMSQYRAKMHETFAERGHGLWHFQRGTYALSHEVPERFFGLV